METATKTKYFPIPSSTGAGYPVGWNMNSVLRYAEEAARAFCAIEELQGKKTIIYCMGSSGAILAGLFAKHLMDSGLGYEAVICHIKKSGEDSHSSYIYKLENSREVSVFIDDFIDFGTTMNNMWENFESENPGSHLDVLIANNCTPYKMELLNFMPKYIISHSSPFES